MGQRKTSKKNPKMSKTSKSGNFQKNIRIRKLPKSGLQFPPPLKSFMKFPQIAKNYKKCDFTPIFMGPNPLLMSK
jgi:hypothetical protein